MSYPNYSLAEDGDNLSLFEKKLRSQFLSKSNQSVVFSVAQRNVDPLITFGTVVDQMYESFTGNLHLSPHSVESLNSSTIGSLIRKRDLSNSATIRIRERDFARSKIPSNFLPRASFKLQEDSDDKILEFFN